MGLGGWCGLLRLPQGLGDRGINPPHAQGLRGGFQGQFLGALTHPNPPSTTPIIESSLFQGTRPLLRQALQVGWDDPCMLVRTSRLYLIFTVLNVRRIMIAGHFLTPSQGRRGTNPPHPPQGLGARLLGHHPTPGGTNPPHHQGTRGTNPPHQRRLTGASTHPTHRVSGGGSKGSS